MARANLRPRVLLAAISALIAGIVPVSDAAGIQGEKAADLLLKSMQRSFPVNISAVIVQRDPSGDGSYQRVKVVRSKDGRVRHTVLQPLRLQGIESIDDGEMMRIYLPDNKALILQESPQKASNDAESRLALAKQNYAFSIGDRPRIAGRQTICVVATPKVADLGVRRYYLDADTQYPLRMELIDPSGKSVPIVDTKDVQYPPKVDAAVFEMRALPGVEKLNYTRPKSLGKSQAQETLGFIPSLPSNLPMGFRVQEIQYNASPKWKSAVVRLSDGLARATVYQWKPNGTEIESIEDSTTVDHNGIRLMLVSDMPAQVRLRLLRAFIQQANAEDPPRALRFIGMMGPRPGLSASAELMAVLWAFAQVDGLAGLSGYGVQTGMPVLR